MPVPMMTFPPALIRRIAGLPQLPITELRALFQDTFGRAPAIANRRFLERRLAYYWQASAYEAAHPGVLAAQRARIAALAAQVAEAEAAARQPRTSGLVPGTVLVRMFAGSEHQVRVAGEGAFEYAGQRYGSLSAVARTITGTRWSGPAFFGLTRRTREREQPRANGSKAR